jgi:hypothetical protein
MDALTIRLRPATSSGIAVSKFVIGVVVPIRPMARKTHTDPYYQGAGL